MWTIENRHGAATVVASLSRSASRILDTIRPDRRGRSPQEVERHE